MNTGGGAARVGLSTLGAGVTLGPRTLRVVLRFRGKGHDARARAAANVLQHAGPTVIYAADTLWGNMRGLVVEPAGSTRLGYEADYRVVEASLHLLGAAEDRAWMARVTSVIRQNAFSRAGETRVPLPRGASVKSGGGTVDAAGGWLTDPTPFQGAGYAANKALTNAEAPTIVEASAEDWAHHTPYVIPGGAHLTPHAVLGSVAGDPAAVSTAAYADHWIVARARATWSGAAPSLAAILEARWNAGGAKVVGTTLAPPRSTAGDVEWMAAWMVKRSADTPFDVRFHGADATLSNRQLDVYALDAAWGLDGGERLFDALVGVGASQVWLRGGAVHLMNARLDGSRVGGAVHLDSGASWWRVEAATRDLVRLTSNAEDELLLWANGVVELQPSAATFRVLPGDTSKNLGGHLYRPHSTRDLRITSLDDFTATAASGVSTVTRTTAGQRWGLFLEANVEAFFRRTRTTWTQRG